MSKIAFIGAGNMGGALVISVCRAIDPQTVAVFDLDSAKVKALSEKTGCLVCDTARDAVKDAEYIVLAVKPQFLRDVFEGIIPVMNKDQKVISIAAGITLESLAEIPLANDLDLPIVRMLPNTPCEIGDGLIIYAGNSKATPEITREVEEMFTKSGLVEHVTEHIINVASAISGCTPAFAYMFIDALADGAVRCGVPRDMAIRYAAQVVKGSAGMVLETGRHPDALKDSVCSPGGSTIVGVATLEDHGFRARAANAVYYANEKNISLGKK